MRVLCVGDIHLGRQPSRVPREVRERLGAGALSPAAAWRRTVDEAIARGADAVLLAGDVVEEKDDFYEAYADLRAGVEKLDAAGIRVIAVAGNHDVDVLPRLADALPALSLLGRGGRWEATVIEGEGGETLRVVGWSFPREVVRESPLDAAMPKRDGTTTIGLLHCDRDQAASAYAPVSQAALEAAPVDAFLLGHIHKPDALAGPHPAGYLGSLSAADPGEAGVHGPWLLETRSGEISIAQIPLAPIRYVAREVAVDDLAEPEAVHGLIVAAIDALHAEVRGAEAMPLAVACRLTLTGRTRLRAEIEALLARDDPRRSPIERDGVVYFVERLRIETLPEIDIESLARGTDPAARLARKLLIIRGPDSPERSAILEPIERALAGVVRARPYSKLGAPAPGPQRVAAIAEDAALDALDRLLRQAGESP